MAVRKTGSQTTVNRGSITAAATLPVNIITGSSSGPSVNITSIQIANSTFHVKDDLAIDTAGGYIIVNGTGFKSGAVVYIQGQAATTTSFVNSSRLNATVPALSSGLLDVYVVNTDGSGSIYLRSLNANGVPSWTTTSPLASQFIDATFAINLVATGAAGDGTITYAVSSGSTLPPGTSLASNGYFYGTVTGLISETTYSFSVDAIDAQNQETARSFNITIILNDTYFRETVLLINGETSSSSVNNNVFVDSSNNNFAVTRNGNPTQGSFSPFSQTGWSNYFDGTGDYLSVPDNVAFDFGTGSFTIEAWINTTVKAPSGENRCIIGTYGSGGNAWWISINSNGRIVYAVDPNLGSYTATKDVTDGLWHHVAMVRNGSSDLRLYIDGILDDSRTVSSSVNTNGTVNIGSLNPAFGLSYFWNGFISNVRVVKDTAVYTGNFTPSTSALTAITNTQLLTCQSNRLIDNSTNAFSITRNGDVSVQAFSPFAPSAVYSAATVGGSGYFDGSGDYLDTGVQSNLYLNASDYTIEFWAYFTRPAGTANAGTLQAALAQGDGSWFGNNNEHNWIALFDNGTFAFGKNPNFYTLSYTVPLNTWTHYAIVGNSSGSITLYVNGVSQGTQTGRTALGSASWSTRIGLGHYGDTKVPNYFQGYMNGVRIVKGTQVYTGNFTPPTSPLTAITNTQLLLNYTNAGIVDATAKNVLETVGNAQLSTAVKKFGSSSIAFDGTGDFIQAGEFSSPIHVIGSGNFTVEVWLYTNTNKAQIIFDTGTTSGSTTGLQLALNSSGYPYFVITNSIVLTSSIIVNTTTWTHVAWVRNNGVINIYVNGVSGGSASNSTDLSDSGLTIGTPNDWRNNSSTFHFDGYLDDLRVTKGVARYTSNFTAPTSSFSLK